MSSGWIAALLVAGLALADTESKVQFKDLPAPVQKAAKEQQSRGATLRGYSKENERGKTFYEIETLVNGKSKDTLVDESGTVVETEQEIDMANIPQAARQALKKEAAGAKILRIESVTEGRTVRYEAVILSGSKRKEIAVTPDGSAAHE